MLKGIEVTSHETIAQIKSIQKLFISTQEMIKKETPKAYNNELIEILFEHPEALFHQPYSRLKTIGDAVGKTSRTTLTKYMDELVQARILTPKKEGTDVFYLNDDLIRILQR